LKDKSNLLLRFSTIGIQMAVIIIAFAYLGNYLDHKWLTKTPYWTAGLLLLGVIISFVVVFRALKKMNNES